jgi:hypothetical protein
MLRNCFFLAAIVLMAAVAFRLTVAYPANAQSARAIVGFVFTTDPAGKRRPAVILSNGDMYIQRANDNGITEPTFYGNFWVKYGVTGMPMK